MPQRVKSQVGYIFTPCYTSEHTHFFLSTVCLSDYHSGILLRQLSFSFYLMPAENKLKFFASKKGIIFLSYLSRGNGKASRRHFRNVPFPFGILCDRSPSWPKRGRFLYRIISIDSSTSRPRILVLEIRKPIWASDSEAQRRESHLSPPRGMEVAAAPFPSRKLILSISGPLAPLFWRDMRVASENNRDFHSRIASVVTS